MKMFLMHPFFRSILAVLLVGIIIVPHSSDARTTKTGDDIPTPTQAELQEKYAKATASGEKLHILVVPGHEPGYGGTEYQGIYEREITVEIADQLAAYLGQNPKIDVVVARSNASWNDDLSDYFDSQWKDIEKFVKGKKKQMVREIRKGDVTQREDGEQVDHAAAPTDVALRLYGINKWANENNIDLVVHLHINDTTDHGPNDPSAHSGYTVYVPDSQYGNAATSKDLGTAIAGELSRLSATSTLTLEDRGVIEDQELIAIGAYGTLSVPSVLIEYGYVTEPRFNHPEVRSVVTKDYALETYRGIEDFLGDTFSTARISASLPFTFASSSIPTIGSSSAATYVLQTALHSINMYPVAGTTTPATLTACPVDGVMGICTTNAVKTFQMAKGFAPTGTLGAQTLIALNTLFSDQPQVQPGIATVSSSCSLPTGSIVLGQKDKGADGDVTRLQKLLSNDATIYPQKLVTGYYGLATQAAVQAFQVSAGVASKGGAGYGLIGPKTKAALQTAYCK